MNLDQGQLMHLIKSNKVQQLIPVYNLYLFKKVRLLICFVCFL